MIDVVFLLLVFFMLAARFESERAAPLAAATANGTARWEGPPRLVTIGPGSAGGAGDGGALRLNGAPVTLSGLAAALMPLMPAPDAPVVLRPAPGASVADLAAVIDALRAAGIGTLVVAE